MKVLVAYFSQSGQTKKVADAIYETITTDKELLELDKVESLDGYDLSFIGFPIIAFGPAPQGRDFLQERAAGNKVALFVTHAAPQGEDGLAEWLDKCSNAAAGGELLGLFDCRGELSEQIADVLVKSDNPMMQEFGERRPETVGYPDEECLERARQFARETMAKMGA
jgi:flavodoxin